MDQSTTTPPQPALNAGRLWAGGLATAMVAALIAIWQHLPFTFLILYAAVISLPEELLEAARVDGATGWQEFRHVILRLVMPALLIALLFRYIFAMRLFSEIWLLTGGFGALFVWWILYRREDVVDFFEALREAPSASEDGVA